jgi:hypothetical protein
MWRARLATSGQVTSSAIKRTLRKPFCHSVVQIVHVRQNDQMAALAQARGAEVLTAAGAVEVVARRIDDRRTDPHTGLPGEPVATTPGRACALIDNCEFTTAL